MPSRDFTNEDLFCSPMMSMHNSTHSSQMNTVGLGDELAHLALVLAAERAVERFLGFAAADSRPSQNPDNIQIITAVTPQAKPGSPHDREGQPGTGGERWRRPRLINHGGSF